MARSKRRAWVLRWIQRRSRTPEAPVRIYTIQGQAMLHTAAATRVLQGPDLTQFEHPADVDPVPFGAWVPDAYAWMRAAIEQRVPHPSGTYPIWGWLQRPNMRTERAQLRMANTPSDGYLVVARVPNHRVVLSDYAAWYSVLLSAPVTYTQAESDAISPDIGPPYLPYIQATWHRIFDFSDHHPEKDWIGSSYDHPKVQACIDQIFAHEICSITHISTGQRYTLTDFASPPCAAP